MKKIIALVALLCLLAASAHAAELDLYAAPEPDASAAPSASDSLPELSEAPLLEAPPMNLNCAAALLLEPESGQILFEMNADSPRAVASARRRFSSARASSIQPRIWLDTRKPRGVKCQRPASSTA